MTQLYKNPEGLLQSSTKFSMQVLTELIIFCLCEELEGTDRRFRKFLASEVDH